MKSLFKLAFTVFCLLQLAVQPAIAAYAGADISSVGLVGQSYVGVAGARTKAIAIREVKKTCRELFEWYAEDISTNPKNCQIVFSGEHPVNGYVATLHNRGGKSFARWNKDPEKAILAVFIACEEAGASCEEFVDVVEDAPFSTARSHSKRKAK